MNYLQVYKFRETGYWSEAQMTPRRYVRYNGTLQRQQTPTTAEGYNNIPVPGINPRLRLNK